LIFLDTQKTRKNPLNNHIPYKLSKFLV